MIGGLWQQLFETGMFFTLPGKVNEKSIGLYTNYSSDESGDYDVYVCGQVDPAAVQASETAVAKIPAGRYARFIVRGDMKTAVRDFWMELWQMPLKRAFTCDFEEYQPGGIYGFSELCVISLYECLRKYGI